MNLEELIVKDFGKAPIEFVNTFLAIQSDLEDGKFHRRPTCISLELQDHAVCCRFHREIAAIYYILRRWAEYFSDIYQIPTEVNRIKIRILSFHWIRLLAERADISIPFDRVPMSFMEDLRKLMIESKPF